MSKHTFEKVSAIACSPRELFDWHARKGAFARLVPPWEDIQVVHSDHSIAQGATLVMRLNKGPAHITWKALHTICEPPGPDGRGKFVDLQESGPFKFWEHTHHVSPGTDPNSAVLTDAIVYELPLNAHRSAFVATFSDAELSRMFDFRHRRTQNDLRRHRTYSDLPMRIAISGASGLIGTALTALLTTGGHEVISLSRSRKPNTAYWNPETDEIDAEALEGLDAVIHLAGESISGRWTETKKRQIMESRVKGTGLLARTLASLKTPPKVFVSASAVGFYGNRKDLPTTELTEPGDGFLAEVCQAWEAAAAPAQDAGIRTVHPRIGVVIAAQGGALKPLVPVFQMGLGGPVGNGKQYMSWIALDDVIAALLHIVKTPDLSGPVNLTAPSPVTNAEFSKVLGKVLHRPSFLPLPSFAVKTAMGEMGEQLLLNGARVTPDKLLRSGFEFHFPTLEEALRFELGRR